MSWAHGIDKYGREVGYAIECQCEAEGCEKIANKGLGCRCGGSTNLKEDFGCGKFFCGGHLYLTLKDQLCEDCIENYAEDEEDDMHVEDEE